MDEWDLRPQVWVVRLGDGQGFPVTGAEAGGGKTVRIDATVWAWTTPSADRRD